MFWMQSALFSNFSILLAYFNYNLCLKNTHTHICWQNFNLNYFHLKQTLSKQAFIDFDLSLKLLIVKANSIIKIIKLTILSIYCILNIIYLPLWPIIKVVTYDRKFLLWNDKNGLEAMILHFHLNGLKFLY